LIDKRVSSQLSLRRRIGPKIGELLGIDRRALAFFRISFGLLLLADVLKRSIALQAHYTDAGVLPRWAATSLFTPHPLIFRVYLWSGEVWINAAFMGLAALMAISFIVGYRTRLVLLLYFVHLISIHIRNPIACHTGDAYLAVLAFWALFLPLGNYFSVDRLRRPSIKQLPQRYVSFGTAAILIQISVFYLMAAVHKHPAEIWQTGQAVSWFAKLSTYTTPIGELLREVPKVCEFATYFSIALEAFGPLLLFCPFFTSVFRMVIVALFVGFHAGIQLVVYIGIFELIAIVAVCVFLPNVVWDRLADWTPAWSRKAYAAARAPWLRLFTRQNYTAGDEPFRRSVLTECFAGFFLVIMLLNNVRTMNNTNPILPGGKTVNRYARRLNLKQRWVIFTYIDQSFTGWFIVEGELEDGSLVDVWNRKDFEGYQKPEGYAESFPNHNWRRVWSLLTRDETYKPVRLLLARYLFDDWNQREDRKLRRLSIQRVEPGPNGEVRTLTVFPLLGR
jgi:hypothetical protein